MTRILLMASQHLFDLSQLFDRKESIVIYMDGTTVVARSEVGHREYRLDPCAANAASVGAGGAWVLCENQSPPLDQWVTRMDEPQEGRAIDPPVLPPLDPQPMVTGDQQYLMVFEGTVEGQPIVSFKQFPFQGA